MTLQFPFVIIVLPAVVMQSQLSWLTVMQLSRIQFMQIRQLYGNRENPHTCHSGLIYSASKVAELNTLI